MSSDRNVHVESNVNIGAGGNLLFDAVQDM